MKTRNMIIKIPDFFPTTSTIRRIWDTLKFKLFPYHCKDCGVKLDFDNIETEYTPPGKKRIMICFGSCICQSCLSKRVHRYFLYRKPTEPVKCDCCGEMNSTISGTGVGLDRKNSMLQKEFELDNPRLILGGAWWNGHDFCYHCIADALENGIQRSSILSIIGKDVYYMNRSGALIKRKENQSW